MEIEKENLIIGGGVAGLIFAFYNPSYCILTENIGGQISSTFQLGPRFLHRTEKIEQFVKDLGIESKIRKIKVGFYYDGKINPHNTEENRKKYLEKTRRNSEMKTSVMSGGLEEFEALDLNFDEIVSIISSRINERILIDKITKIDLKEKKVFSNDNIYNFKNLVVAISKSIFCKLIGEKEESKKFQYYPTTFIRSKRMPHLVKHIEKDFKNYDYVYFSEPDLEFHRISKIGDKEYCIEIKGENLPYQEFEEERITTRIGQIIEREDTITYPDFVDFIGRYGRWEHKIKINELVEEMIK